MTAFQVEAIARAVHEANRAWCLACGDESQVPWDDAEEWLRDTVRRGVVRALDGAGPRELHETWVEDKLRDGWRCGPVKDAEAMTHPCMVPYDQLPPEQRAKDGIFAAVVGAFAEAYRLA